MGLFRKLLSVSTVGVVDYRSDKEWTALYTRQARNADERATREATRQAARPPPLKPSHRNQRTVDESRARLAQIQELRVIVRTGTPDERVAAMTEINRIHVATAMSRRGDP